MANSMGLPIPIVGVDTGPNWANAINNCLNLIAEHTHAAGSGVQITPTGLNINAPLLFNGNPAQSLAYVNILPQGISVAIPINASLYISGLDLFFKDGAGNNIRVTQGGNVLASSSGISLGTASASFIGNTLTVIQSPGVAAPIDAASYILRYNGSYPTPAGAAVVLQAPSSLPGAYALTFPTGLPGVNNALMASNTAGQLSFRTPDQVGQDMTSVGANAIGQTMTAVGANAIGQTMTSVGANAIGSQLTTVGANLQSGGRNVVVSSTNAASSLAIIRGYISAAGGIITGEGFTISHPSTGVYNISFNVAFASNPTFQFSPTAQPGPFWAFVSSVSTSGINIITGQGNLNPFNTDFMFLIIGPR